MEAVEGFWLSLADNVVLLMVVMPLVGAGLVRLMSFAGAESLYFTGLVNVWLTAVLTVIMVARFEPGQPDVSKFSTRMTSSLSWLRQWERRTDDRVAEAAFRETSQRSNARWHPVGPDVRLSVGANRYSLWFMVLTVATTLAVFRSIPLDDSRLISKLSWLLLTESAMLGAYAAQDVIMLALCCQVSTLGLFFLIGQGNNTARREAARRFFRTQVVSGGLILFGLTGVAISHWWMQIAVDPSDADLTFSLRRIVADVTELSFQTDAAHDLWTAVSPWLFVTLCAGFALRLPMPPLHNWWSRVSERADSRIVALMSVGYLPLALYAVVRIIVPMFPELVSEIAPRLFLWGLLSALFLALSALRADDLRRKLSTAGLASVCVAFGVAFHGNLSGSQGGLLLMVSMSGSLALLYLSSYALVGGQRQRPQGRYAHSSVLTRLPLLLSVVGISVLPLSGSCWGWLLIVESVFRRSSSLALLLVVTTCVIVASLCRCWTDLTNQAEPGSAMDRSDRLLIRPGMWNVMPIGLILAAAALAPQWVVGPPQKISVERSNGHSTSMGRENDPADGDNAQSLAKSALNAE